MGRGLSELQKSMLALAWAAKDEHDSAYRNKELVERWMKWDHDNFNRYLLPDEDKPVMPIEFKPFIEDNWLGAVYFSEVLKEVYGWTPKPREYKPRCPRPDTFSKAAIGPKKYMAVYIAVRKAGERLERRGLIRITRNHRDFYLTDAGEKTAILLAKT